MADNKINPDRMRDVIDKASQHARMTYYLYLGFISYCAVTVFSTTDRQLALKGDTANLPILNISVPLDGFFILAPILCIGLFIYLMLYLNRLNMLVGQLEEYCNDPLNKESFNENELFPWIINIARNADKGVIGTLQKLLVRLTLWYTLPIIICIFAYWVVKKHEKYLSLLIIGLFLISIYVTYWFWYKFEGEYKYSKKRNTLTNYGIIMVLIVMAFYATIILVPEINDGKRSRANLNLSNDILVKIPDIGEDVEQGYWVDLGGVNLNHAHINNSVLQKANLEESQLKGAFLVRTDLKEANLQRAELQGADLKHAIMNNSDLKDTKLEDADLSFAKLEHAKLNNANLKLTNLTKAILKNAQLETTDLTNANLQSADLTQANLKGAVLVGASLYDSRLTDVHTINAEQLCKAATLYGAKLEPSWSIAVQKLCGNKREKKSYLDWQKEYKKRERTEEK